MASIKTNSDGLPNCPHCGRVASFKPIIGLSTTRKPRRRIQCENCDPVGEQLTLMEYEMQHCGGDREAAKVRADAVRAQFLRINGYRYPEGD